MTVGVYVLLSMVSLVPAVVIADRGRSQSAGVLAGVAAGAILHEGFMLTVTSAVASN